MDHDERIAEALLTEARRRLAHSVAIINHCLAQLDDQQTWWRPHRSMNSVANLVLHVCGNLRQWIVAGLGGEADTRERAKEFLPQASIPKDQLARRLRDVAQQADDTIRNLSVAQLLAPRRIQGFDISGLSALLDSLGHLQGHTQEIVHLTREQLADDYQFHWVPTTAEEGAG